MKIDINITKKYLTYVYPHDKM